MAGMTLFLHKKKAQSALLISLCGSSSSDGSSGPGVHARYCKVFVHKLRKFFEFFPPMKFTPGSDLSHF